MKKIFTFAMFLLLIGALVACGGGNEEPASNESNNEVAENETNNEDQNVEGTEEGTEEATANEITIEATNWEFNEEVYTVSAGEIAIHYTNEEGMHGFVIEGTDYEISKDGTYTVELEPGEYEIACSIMCGTGHNDMTAKIVVQ